MKKLSILLIVLFSSLSSMSAQHKFGIRAGLNYSKFSGELETNEAYDFNTGFHFGFNYTYQLNTTIGFRTELLYTQRGSKQSIQDDAIYNVIRAIDGTTLVEIGNVDYNIGLSLSYFSIPFTVQVKVANKFEIFGGASIDLLFAPTGGGTTVFQSRDRPDQIRYTLRHDHNYRTDLARGIADFTQNEVSSQILNGNTTNINTVLGAYYYYTADELEAQGKRFRFFDTNLILGFNYFINSGFFLGLRAEYGLFDLTNNQIDPSLREINADGSFIFREDKDNSRSLSLSFGFRF